jgi:hypothetical protein
MQLWMGMEPQPLHHWQLVANGLHIQWMGIWNHQQPVTNALVDPNFDSRLKAIVTAGLQTIPLCSG